MDSDYECAKSPVDAEAPNEMEPGQDCLDVRSGKPGHLSMRLSLLSTTSFFLDGDGSAQTASIAPSGSLAGESTGTLLFASTEPSPATRP